MASDPTPKAAPVRTLAAALRRAVFGVGPVATVRAIAGRLRLSADGAGQTAPNLPAQAHPFDVEFGVDTGGFRSWRQLQVGAVNDAYSSGYLGVAPSVGRRLIGLVPKPEDHSFVDLGCGKGRALILASERPFRRVIGVEISAELAEAARRNATIIRARFPDRPAITVVTGDAAAFELPPGPVVVFMYQPFELAVMRRVAHNLAASGRPVWVIYVNPAHARVFDRDRRFVQAGAGTLALEGSERAFAYGGSGIDERFAAWTCNAPTPSF